LIAKTIDFAGEYEIKKIFNGGILMTNYLLNEQVNIMDNLVWDYTINDNVHLLKFKMEKHEMSSIKFTVIEDEQLIKIELVVIRNDFRNDLNLTVLMCNVFSMIYYQNFNDYYFDYRYLDERFKYLINRKVKSGKLPKKIIELHPMDYQTEYKKIKNENQKLHVELVNLELELTNLKIQKSILENQVNDNLKNKIDKRIVHIEEKINNLQKYFIDDNEIQNKALDKVKVIQESRKAVNKYKELQK
jgi:hypothetical protein